MLRMGNCRISCTAFLLLTVQRSSLYDGRFQENIVESIQEIVPGAVQIGKFHTRIFPHPGCEAEESPAVACQVIQAVLP